MSMSEVLRVGTAEEAGLRPESLEHVRARANEWLANGTTASLVALVARRGIIAMHETFGDLTHEPESPPLQIDSVYPVSSLAKPVTATAVMMLVEDGLVSLTRPVVEYIPELSGKGVEQILVHHLLTHTSGFDEEQINAFITQRLSKRMELPPLGETEHSRVRLVLNAIYPADPARGPGELMSYYNLGYALLSEIVRRASGQAFEDFTRERIFEPLGMSDSSFRLNERFEGRLVRRGPDRPFTEGTPVNLDDPAWLDIPWGYGGLLSNARDLAVFGQTFLNGGTYGEFRLLSRASVVEMTRNQIPGLRAQFGPFDFDASYGYGFFVQGSSRGPMNGGITPEGSFSHAGQGGTRFWVDLENEIVGVYLAVCTKVDPETGFQFSDFPLFQDMVTASAAR